ncbi:MAG: sodium-dependent bicarbonate transport family permease [Nitrospinae bacterium CG11_big_fil_rev_8_21_14_0_20_45_15]|nr:MAG: sodium-dependent bicarbonate transport family permease [Nitrospinae bacterium CG11_big_fil_rev_8_21_14_0_20_45_15]
MIEAIVYNLTAPMPLFFVLGIFATLIKSDLKIPDALYIGLTLYLLAAIGLKGGAEIQHVGLLSIYLPVMGCLFLGTSIPIAGYYILRKWGGFNIHDAAAVAGHYGSVSAVTFVSATQFLSQLHIASEGYTSAFLAIFEPTGVITGILLARIALQLKDRRENATVSDVNDYSWLKTSLHESLTNTGSLILAGSLVIGFISGEDGIHVTEAFFGAPFKGILCIFMLEMGLVAGRRLMEIKHVGVFLVFFGILIPLISGFLGVMVGQVTGLSIGGMTLMGVMAASASYIAAPAAMRVSLPEANPSLYLTASLGITFPFNIAFGIPIYLWIANHMAVI